MVSRTKAPGVGREGLTVPRLVLSLAVPSPLPTVWGGTHCLPGSLRKAFLCVLCGSGCCLFVCLGFFLGSS